MAEGGEAVALLAKPDHPAQRINILNCSKGGLMRGRAVILLLFFMADAVSAPAVSFDCAKAANPVEVTICGNAEISNLDDHLSSLYKQALSADAGNQELLRKDQRLWLLQRNQCTSIDCIKSLYSQRISVLAKYAGAPRTASPESSENQDSSGDFFVNEQKRAKGKSSDIMLNEDSEKKYILP